MLSWVEGRQKTGYYKMKLLESKWLKFDVYLLKYPTGSSVPLHTDPVKGYEHHRINIVKHAKTGGHFALQEDYSETYGPMMTLTKKRFYKFRPDTQQHGVLRVFGTRYVLSIGWLK